MSRHLRLALGVALLASCVVQPPPSQSPSTVASQQPPAQQPPPAQSPSTVASQQQQQQPAQQPPPAPTPTEAPPRPTPATPPATATAVVKKARSGDVASSYRLDSRGNLFRTVNGHPCQVTNHVVDFKVSQHPHDAAMIYFVRKERGQADLYVLHNAAHTGRCPKAKRLEILPKIRRRHGGYAYSLVPSIHTKIVAVGLARNGRFVAWSTRNTVLTKRGIKAYVLHQKFGKRGAPFRRYVAFAINRSGNVLKLNGKHPARSKFDRSHHYVDLAQFRRQNLRH